MDSVTWACLPAAFLLRDRPVTVTSQPVTGNMGNAVEGHGCHAMFARHPVGGVQLLPAFQERHFCAVFSVGEAHVGVMPSCPVGCHETVTVSALSQARARVSSWC